MFASIPLGELTSEPLRLKPNANTGLGGIVQGSELDSVFYGFVLIARSWICLLPAVFFFAVAVLSLFGFLTTENAEVKFIVSISAVVNLVAAMKYRYISRMRSGREVKWFGTDVPSEVEEMAVDSLRYAFWAVSVFLTTLQMYAIVNRNPFGTGYDGIFNSEEAAAAVGLLGVVLAAYTRIGTDELWDLRQGTRIIIIWVTGVVALAGAITCFVLLLIDLGRSSHAIVNGGLLRSFFYVWIGQGLVVLLSIVARVIYARCGPETRNAYPSAIAVFKDFAFGMLDVYAFGFLGLWTAYTAFGRALFLNPMATPYPW